MFGRSIGIYSRPLGVFRSGIRGGIRGGFRFNSTKIGHLSWTEYFALKKRANRVNFVSSTFTALVGVGATLHFLADVEFDPEKTIMGMDPTIILFGVTLMGGFLGYLAGPVIGTPIFNMRNKAVLKQFQNKEKDFLQKIKRNRVNPSTQSVANPVPDYYGEKIFSVKDYRQWLRDCNAFRRKSQEFL